MGSEGIEVIQSVVRQPRGGRLVGHDRVESGCKSYTVWLIFCPRAHTLFYFLGVVATAMTSLTSVFENLFFFFSSRVRVLKPRNVCIFKKNLLKNVRF